MSSNLLESKFWELIKIADDMEEADADVPDLEPTLLELLTLVKSNPNNRELFVHCFSALGIRRGRYSAWPLLFCMRELRYPEVQFAVNDYFNSLGGVQGAPRMMNFVSDVNWAYDEAPWENAIFFKYYWLKEHPNEPWPISND